VKHPKLDFHTAPFADRPCVFVFTTNADGEQDEVIAEFYPLPDEPDLSRAEARAIEFLRVAHWEFCR
jgi:hypothetical protein